MLTLKKALHLLCLCLTVSAPVAGQAIKLGSLVAPEVSPWDRALRRIAAALEWFGLAKNMTDLPIAPMLSSIVVSERAWSS
jgi:hypothetical protein